MAHDLLAIRGLTVRYGKATAISDLSLEVHPGEVVSLLGANGAGKTTLLNAVSGFLPSATGSVTFEGSEIGGDAPHRIFRRGIVQVSQARDLFPALSVLDNLELGATTRRDDIRPDLARVFAYFPRLEERRQQAVGTLSGGEQRMVAIGRGLMGRPKILLLDEPSGGLAPRFVDEIGRIMKALKAVGTTMLLVEQNIGLALSVADRFYVLREGVIAHAGAAAELTSDYAQLAREYYL